jgi:hypothetical protein
MDRAKRPHLHHSASHIRRVTGRQALRLS